jgi:hypothetical protein
VNSREVCQTFHRRALGAQVAFHEGGQAEAVGAPVASDREERLEPLADDLMEERLLGLPPPVSAQGCALPASAAPRSRGVARGGHGRPRRKGRASSAASALFRALTLRSGEHRAMRWKSLLVWMRDGWSPLRPNT